MLSRRSLPAVTLLTLLLSAALGALAVEAAQERDRVAVPDVESAAKPLWPDAQTHARGWRRDAVLLRVFATEGHPPGARAAPPLLYDTSHDPAVGNGRALAWTFAYASPSAPDDVFFVGIGGDGRVLDRRALAEADAACCADPRPAMADEARPDEDRRGGVLAPPALDADEAMALARQAPIFRDFPSRHPVFQAFLDLSLDARGRPAWRVGYATADAFAAHAQVDATTGAVTQVRAYPERFAPPPPTPCCGAPEPAPAPAPCCRPPDVHRTFRATTGPSRPADAIFIPVEAAAWARSLRITVRPDEGVPLPPEDLDARLADGEGRTLRQTRGAGPVELLVDAFPSQGLYELSLFAPAALRDASYTVEVELLHADAPRAAPEAYAFQGVLRERADESRYPLHLPDGRLATHAALVWTSSSPVGVVELALLDGDGNEVETLRGEQAGPPGRRRDLRLDLPPACCATLVVRHVNGIAPQPYELEIVAPAPFLHDDAGAPTHAH